MQQLLQFNISRPPIVLLHARDAGQLLGRVLVLPGLVDPLGCRSTRLAEQGEGLGLGLGLAGG